MELDDRQEEALEHFWREKYEPTLEHGHPMGGHEDASSAQGGDASHLDGLLKLGLVSRQGASLELTPAGVGEAERVVRRHRLAERLLHDVLQVRRDSLEASACRFEHLLHPDLEERVCTLLGHPSSCPHGRPIPAGPCCREARVGGERLVSSLDRMRPGERGTVAYVQSLDEGQLRKLMAMGILPGVSVALEARSPSYVFHAGNSQFAVDREIATLIHVRLSAAELPSSPGRPGPGWTRRRARRKAGTLR